MKVTYAKGFTAVSMAALLTLACAPTVKVEAPDKPIEINMNIHITQEVRIKIEKDVDKLIQSNSELF